MKCRNCGETIIKFPLWKDQEKGVKFSWDKLLIWNLFKIDIQSLILIIIIVALVLGYKADISKCEDAINNPCVFCEKSNCCVIDWDRVTPSAVIQKNMIDIKDIPNYED